MLRKTFQVLILFLVSLSAGHIYPQEQKASTGLNYTVIGPVAGGGMNFITREDWYTDRRESRSFKGYNVSCGAVFNIFVMNIIGDVKIQYILNLNKESNIQHLVYHVSGKYMWETLKGLHVTAGPGIYFETPPSSGDYNGSGGGFISAGLMYSMTFDSRLFVNLTASYGHFGLGEGSTKFTTGINLGYLFKIGRI